MKFSEYTIKLDEGKEDKIIKSIEKARKKKDIFDIRDKVILMDLPDRISQKIKKALDNKIKLLKEERIHSQDKRAIISFIKHPKDDNYKMKDDEKIKIKKINNGVSFSFDKENYELSMTIIDIIDALGGYKSSSKPGFITAILKGE